MSRPPRLCALNTVLSLSSCRTYNGAGGIRTRNRANRSGQLYQLSYGPDARRLREQAAGVFVIGQSLAAGDRMSNDSVNNHEVDIRDRARYPFMRYAELPH